MSTDLMYNKDFNEKVASDLELYLDQIDNLFIIEGKDKDEIDNAKKVVKKAIKHLKNNKPEKVYDFDRFEDIMSDSDMGDDYYE